MTTDILNLIFALSHFHRGKLAVDFQYNATIEVKIYESEEWSSQYIFQFKQLERRSVKNIRASTGFEPVTSAIPVRCSTNWAMKPHIGYEINLLSSYLPVRNEMRWYEVIHIWSVIWFLYELLSDCLNWKIYCDDHSSLSSTTAVNQIWITSYIHHIKKLCYDFLPK